MSRDQGTSWMYKSQMDVDTDQYLTGKKIDKAFENFLDAQLQIEKEKRAAGTTSTGEQEADLYNKRLEDPMNMIKAREKSAKERLKANPKKMAMMRAIFDQMMDEKLGRMSTKKSKKKKKKKKVESSSESSDSERDMEMERLRDESNMRRDGSWADKTKGWNDDRFRSTYINRFINKDETQARNFQGDKASKYLQDREDENQMAQKSSSSRSKKSSSDKDRDRLSSTKKDKEKRKKDKEKAKKLAMMMQDANDYEQKRIKKSKSDDKQAALEEAEDKASAMKGAVFMKDVKQNFNDAQSLEDRIRSRKHRQLRTENDMSKNSFKLHGTY